MASKNTKRKGRPVFVEHGAHKTEYSAFLVEDVEPRGSLHYVEWESTGEREWVQETQLRFPEDVSRVKRTRRQPVWWHSQEYQVKIEDEASAASEAVDLNLDHQKKVAKKKATKPKKVSKVAASQTAKVSDLIGDMIRKPPPRRPKKFSLPRKSKAGGPPPPSLNKKRPAPPRIYNDEKKVILKQFHQSYPYFDTPRCEEIIQEYIRFMILKMEQPHLLYTPSTYVKAMWQAHMLCSWQYFAFVERHNGGQYIHHDPTIMPDEERYALTLDAYGEKFGKPKVWIWPEQLPKTGGIPTQDSASQKVSIDTEASPKDDSDCDKGSFASSFQLNLESVDVCDKGHSWLRSEYDTDCSGCQRIQDDL